MMTQLFSLFSTSKSSHNGLAHQFILSCCKLSLAILILVTAPTNVFGASFSTSFEFIDTSGEFTLGESPDSVTFNGGEAKSVGNFSLYHSGTNAWMIDAGNTGTIIFETPAVTVNLFFKDQDPSNQSVLNVFDTDNELIVSLDGTSNDWTELDLSVADGMAPIGSITLQNNGSSGYSVIDDFSFATAMQGDATPLEDPIPKSIKQGGKPIALVTVATGLTAPNWGTSAPGRPGQLFVVDQPGILWAIDLATGTKSVFLDVSARLVELGIFGPGSFDERGFLGVTFHPDFGANGLLYTYTSEPYNGTTDFSTMPAGIPPQHQSIIIEWRVDSPLDPMAVVNPASARELLRIDQPQFNHNAGALDFGPDGMLYVALGDGGGADDVDGQVSLGVPMVGHGTGNGQDPSNVLGAILRIDPTGSNSANGQYGIPMDNPFVGLDGFVDEIFAYGFRNPFRFSFDRLTGQLFVADVGQNDIEEVSMVTAGGNYGWNLKEGSFFFEPNGNDSGFVTDVDPGVPSDLIDPIAEYDHDEGISVIGGFVYRGSAIPSLRGRYVFGEFARTFNNDGRLFFLKKNKRITEFRLADRAGLGLSLLGFGQDAAGELYVLGNATGTPFENTGVVLRIVAANVKSSKR